MRECTGDEAGHPCRRWTITVKIAERCQVEFTFGHHILPQVRGAGRQGQRSPSSGKSAGEGFAASVTGRMPPQEYRDRLEYELSVIEKMGYVDYYLIVWDFIDYAKRNGIPVGPGTWFRCGQYCGLLYSVSPASTR